MPLPIERVVTGRYANPVTGEPYDGTDGSHYVVFEPVPDRWVDQVNNQILLGAGRVNLDADGTFSETLICTDAEGVIPEEGRLWRIRQLIDGSWSPVHYFALPYGDGSPIDISDLLSGEGCGGATYVPVPGPPGPPGVIQSINGISQPHVILDADNVSAIPLAQKGVAGGVASLDALGRVPSVQLPPSSGGSGGAVDSVNGQTGNVVLGAADVGAVSTDLLGQPNGVALLNDAGVVTALQLPPPITHMQMIPSSLWTISHDFSAVPDVDVYDGNGELVMADVSYPDSGTVAISFAYPETGKAVLHR